MPLCGPADLVAVLAERRRGLGAPAKKLAHKATLSIGVNDTPSHAGTKHMCLGDVITSSSPIPAKTGDEVGYSA